MENWQLFLAAFILSLVDLGVLSAFLWYQLSTLYFAWHLCPMILNRICELIAFLFTGGMLPSLFSIVQVPLSLFSTTVYANRQQHLENKFLLAVYCTLLVYEFLVAVLMIKMGRYLKCPTRAASQQILSTSQQAPRSFIAFHMFALYSQPEIPGCPFVSNIGSYEGSQMHSVVTVEQPDGKKIMLGKVVPSDKDAEKTVAHVPDGHQQVVGDTTSGVSTLYCESDIMPETDHRFSSTSEVLCQATRNE